MTNLEKSRLKSVDDEYIGDLRCLNQKWRFDLREDFSDRFAKIEECKDFETIAVILESPHKDEFDQGLLPNGIESRPLNHQESRDALIKILETVTTNFYNTARQYRIVLINAVKFQCSLGGDLARNENKDIRNENWIKNWIENQDDFVSRLSSISPDLIINLCTQGTYKKDSTNYQEFDENYIKKFGLKFKSDSTVPLLISVKKSFGKDKFTLQEIVEYKLQSNNLITNSNYTKYYHPSRFTYQSNPEFTKLEGKHKINFSKDTLEITEIQPLTTNN